MYRVVMRAEAVFTRIVEGILAVTFIAIFVMVFYQVVLRYVFRTGVFGTAELYTVMFAYTAALGSAVMLRQREHIRITVLIDRLPRNARLAFLVVDYVVIAVFSIFVFVQSLPWLRSISLFRSQVTGISRAVESLAIPIGFGMIVLYCVINVAALLLDPQEANVELGLEDQETQRMIQEAAEADRRFLEHRYGKGKDS